MQKVAFQSTRDIITDGEGFTLLRQQLMDLAYLHLFALTRLDRGLEVLIGLEDRVVYYSFCKNGLINLLQAMIC